VTANLLRSLKVAFMPHAWFLLLLNVAGRHELECS
jgi:hypothetical protein